MLLRKSDVQLSLVVGLNNCTKTTNNLENNLKSNPFLKISVVH